MITWAASSAVVAGFQTTVLPTIAGAAARLPPIDVKLNGLIASTKPSSGRWSMRFHTPGEDTGCVSWSCSAEVHVPAPEVDQLAGGVDLRLVDALALSEDGRGVEPVAERAAQKVGGAEEDRGTGLPRRGRPVVMGGERRVDGGADLVGGSGSRLDERQGVAVRGRDRDPLAVTVDRSGRRCGGARGAAPRPACRWRAARRRARSGDARGVEVNGLVDRWLRTHRGDCGAASV